MSSLYLDHAATTPVRREVLEAMWPHLTGEFGNPSSRHALGDRAAAALADARRRLASWFGGRASEVTFTSGGTESINLAVKGIALGRVASELPATARPVGRHVVTAATEHEATLASVEQLVRLHGFTASFVGVDRFGRIDLDELATLVTDDTALVTLMLANNEIGTVQDAPAIAAITRAHGVPLHLDAVQAAGRLDLRAETLGADAVSISGHKLGAPKGVGALWARGRLPIEPLVAGGGQERGRRSGTENVAAAVGLAVAAELGELEREAESARLTALRDAFTAAVVEAVPGAVPTGHPEHRLPGIASFLFPGTSGESVLLALEEREVVVSSGSACAAGSDEASHVLVALGVEPTVAQTAVRFSFGAETTADALAHAVRALRESLAQLAG